MSDEFATTRVTGITEAYEEGLRGFLELTKDQCFMVIAPIYIEGQPELCVQIIPGEAEKDESGDSLQDGGSLSRNLRVTVVVWKRLLTDRFKHSENILKDGKNLLDLFEKIRYLFSMTTLGGLLSEPVKFSSETATSWADEKLGVVRHDIVFSNRFRITLPTKATL